MMAGDEPPSGDIVPGRAPPGESPHESRAGADPDGDGPDEAAARKRWEQVERILDDLLDAEPSRWPSLLDEACAGDTVLRREVEGLLRRHEAAKDFLGTPATGAVLELLTGGGRGAEGSWPVEGRPVGPYRLLREIGRGGMGRVFLAERADGAFERRVALKLLRPGPYEREAERRFRAERQILASLEHPAIARLLDGGGTEEGLPWLAMEYVDGEPIDRYCDARGLPVRRRLELFLAVTSAVQYAHRNLVVHRDLKPSNILVTDEEEVKLLDFGIAKLLPESGAGALPSGAAPGAAPLTRPGERLLTPEYSAPEQVRGEPATTATDVYQLGVVLYELLTGRRPFQGTGSSLHELENAVLEREPERPSTAVSAAAGGPMLPGEAPDHPEASSRARSSRPDRLRRALAGDLDAIVLKALRKEPEERYASAGEMGEDIRRYLAGLPVAAHVGSRAYRLRKFVRRHRAGTAAAAVVAASLLAGAGVALWQASVARGERDRAEAALARAEAALARSQEVTESLIGLFEASSPFRATADTAAAREILRRGVMRAEELGEEPVVQARMLDALGRVYRELGRFETARGLLKRALALRRAEHGEEHPEVAESMKQLARVLVRLGEHDRAEALHARALEVLGATVGEDDLRFARTLIEGRLGAYGTLEEAEAAFRRALAIQREVLGEHPLVANSLLRLAATLRRRGGRVDEAEALLREAVAMRRRVLGPEHPDVAAALFHLGDLLRVERGDLDAADSLYRQGLAIHRALDYEHPGRVHGLNSLGDLLAERGDQARAEALYRRTLALVERVFGPEHHDVALSLNRIAATLRARGRQDEAEALYRRALAMQRELRGEDHNDVAGTLLNLGSLLTDRGDYEEAEPLLREALSIWREHENHARAAAALSDLATLDLRRGRYAAAEALLEEALATALLELDEDHRTVRALYGDLADLYRAWGRPADAARYRRRADPDGTAGRR